MLYIYRYHRRRSPYTITIRVGSDEINNIIQYDIFVLLYSTAAAAATDIITPIMKNRPLPSRRGSNNIIIIISYTFVR